MLSKIIKLAVSQFSRPVLSGDQTYLLRAEKCASLFQINHLASLFTAQIHFTKDKRGKHRIKLYLPDEIRERWIVRREGRGDVYSPMSLRDAAPYDRQRFQFKESTHDHWVEFLARVKHEFVERSIMLVCFTKWARAGHSIISICDTYDARSEWNLLAAQTFRVAGAVIILVVIAYGVGHVRHLRHAA